MNRPLINNRQDSPLPRRKFLASAGVTLSGASLAASSPAALKGRPKVAAIFTVFTHRSHAHVILENFLEQYLFNGKPTDPGVDVVSFFADQTPDGDMSRDVSRRYRIPLYKTIAEAICAGGKELAVDAVLSIGEHGNYPTNEFGQREYPRRRFFDESVEVMRRSGRFVPLFNDKHLSFRWDWAKEMYDIAQRHQLPLMAGSSVPLAQRRPSLELPNGARFEEAISIHGGPVESYDFHGLEVLQSLVESRKGGETGVANVEFVKGESLWNAEKAGRWSLSLANAAMACELGESPPTLEQIPGEGPAAPHALLVTYRDGFKAAVLKVGQSSTRWNFACRLKNDPQIRATSFYVGPWRNRNLFKALSHAIQAHFRNREAPYPVERTLLVTGLLESAMRSRRAGKAIDTPHLQFGYKPRDFRAMRELGATWKIITEEMPEPTGISRVGV